MAARCSQLAAFALLSARARAESWVSASGDPMLLAPSPSVQVVGWNFCNMALAPTAFSDHPSPRWADCTSPSDGSTQLVSSAANALGPGDAFPLPGFNSTSDANAYAVEKELFFGAVCERPSASAPGFSWSGHKVMFKSGNMDINASVCPETVARSRVSAARASAASEPATAPATAPAPAAVGARFNNLAMNQPLTVLVQQSVSALPYGARGALGFAAGTYDVDPRWTPAQTLAVQAALDEYARAWIAFRFAEVDGAPLPPRPDLAPPALLANASFIATAWWKNASSGSTVFSHWQGTSALAPWLMNYLKLTDAAGLGGGYDWPGAGNMNGPVPAYRTRVNITYRMVDRAKGGFGGLYVPCHAGCWQLSGAPCNGTLDLDITRYICFIAEDGSQGCSAKNQAGCPPFHILSGSHEVVLRNDTARFPYNCYSGHCPPGGCDPYSNPGPQELMMLLPCSERVGADAGAACARKQQR